MLFDTPVCWFVFFLNSVQASRMSTQNIMELHDGLPKQFVTSLKILFDILDEEHSGLIRLRDVESRWSDEGVRDLPTGVMEGLRKVSPPSGLLSFDCFVAGLKFALFQGKDQVLKKCCMSASQPGGLMQKENRTGFVPLSVTNTRHFAVLNQPLQTDTVSRQERSASSEAVKQNNPVGILRSAVSHRLQKNPTDVSPATAAVKPQPNTSNNTVSAYRRMNSPQINLSPLSSDHTHHNYSTSCQGPPPRPERAHHNSQIEIVHKSVSGLDQNPPQIPPRDQRQSHKIVNDQKSWHQDWVGYNGVKYPGKGDKSDDPQVTIYANIDQFQKKQEEAQSQQVHSPSKVTVRRHGSGRRHTLQNGVDQNMIKRMQQLDEENSMLKHGLEMVDMARDWYLRQLAFVQDKQRMLGKINYNDNSLEAHQERMNFQQARITEVNMQLRTLVDSSEKGFPLHMNLLVTSQKGSDKSSNAAIKLVREQNRRLIQELSVKSNRISTLEQEKASLIRELFESRSKHKSNYDDTTFM